MYLLKNHLPQSSEILKSIISKGRQDNSLINERMLNIINEGKVTLSINGKPILLLDSDSKSFEIEISGLQQNDLKLSNLLEAKKSKRKVFLETSHLARKLIKNGWSFSLYDRGEQLLTAKKRLSKIGPRLYFNPLKLKRILDVL